MVRVSSPAKLRPWSELTAKMVMGVVPELVISAKRRAYFCKSIAIEMGGVSRYFSKASGSGVDLTLPENGESFCNPNPPHTRQEYPVFANTYLINSK